MRKRIIAAPIAVGVMLAGSLALVPGVAHASEAVNSGLGLGDVVLESPAEGTLGPDAALLEDELSQHQDGVVDSSILSGDSLGQGSDASASASAQEGDSNLSLDEPVEGDGASLDNSTDTEETTGSADDADNVDLIPGNPTEDVPANNGDETLGEIIVGDEGESPIDDAEAEDEEGPLSSVDEGLTSDDDQQEFVAGGAADGTLPGITVEDNLSNGISEAQEPTEAVTDEGAKAEDSAIALSEEQPAAAEAKAVEEKVSNVQLYRLYNPYSGEHLYTSDARERDNLVRLGWRSEGNAWVSPSSGVITYRLYNPYSGDHHYTTDLKEYNHLSSIGWKKEGLAWYGAASDGVALFRMFNPYVSVGTHHFTSSASERLRMVSDGWRYEGIAWFGVDLGPLAPAGAASGWATNGGSRFYIDGNGNAVTGWQTIGGTKYHFDNKGRLSTGVTDVDGTIYYFQDSGAAHKGWATLSGYKYYFNTDGSLKRSGWFTDGGKTYYLDPTSGAMATGKRWIDGYLRLFDSNGVCLKTGYQTKWGNLMLAARNVTLPGYAQDSYWSYVHPCTISANATRAEVIEAFINAAYDYQRTPTRWVDNQCGRPGTTVDCSGLVMESLYAVGMDLTGVAGGDFNPYSKYYWNHHFANTWRTNNTFQPISVSQLERGDIIYYSGHVVIYLGNGRILESTPYASNVREASMYSPGTILGCARPFTK